MEKNNPSTEHPFGQVNFMGFETEPTAAMVENRKQVEIKFVEDLMKDPLSTNSKIELIKILSCRIMDLRSIQIKKDSLKNRLMEEAGSIWRKTKYLLVISAVLAHLYQIKTVVHSLLENIDLISYDISINNKCADFIRSNKVLLQEQINYNCLSAFNKMHSLEMAPYVKQRTPEWFSLRSKCLVTGSTIHAAIGLDTLKAKVQDFEHVVPGKEKPPHSQEVRKQSQYCCKNYWQIIKLMSLFLTAAKSSKINHNVNINEITK